MGEEISAQFLAALWRLQDEAGLTNAQLARDLGCKRSYLSRVKAGGRKSNISYEFALRAARRFPELRQLLSPDVLDVTSSVTTISGESQEGGR